MATLVLGGVGSAVGSAVFGPTGAAIGYGLGSYVGGMIDQNYIFKEKKRVPELSSGTLIQTSSEGKIIPRVYGKSRLAGNVIWATPIRETYSTITSPRGKGGRSNSPASKYQKSYHISCAIALCHGEVQRIDRVFIDFSEIDKTKLKMRFYSGTKDQLPDPLIESYQGVGQTPAFRDLSYVVIEDLYLENYGHRLPNFSFEVIMKDSEKKAAKIEGVVVIPGSGEFVYDTEVISKVSGDSVDGNFIFKGKSVELNRNNYDQIADASYVLNTMARDLPELKYIALTSCWFADSLDIGKAEIIPMVEYREVATTLPREWKVAGYTRSNAKEMLKTSNGSPLYGGTPDDQSIINYLKSAQQKSYKIMFYPMINVALPDKPWRGYISGNEKDIEQFFRKEKGYNQFILHYARLVKDHVDTFIIGSELKELTSIRDENGEYKAVKELVLLAKEVKKIVGKSVKVSYAADWSEYHHNSYGDYGLDELFASPDIDFVGIDAYFPLTSKDHDPHSLSIEQMADLWDQGEGYDYYLDGAEKKTLDKPYQWKNIEWWWANEHFNSDGRKTKWQPRMKKIWFTEIGYPSIDRATDQPNLFYDPESSSGGVPETSEAKMDLVLQKKAIEAALYRFHDSPYLERMYFWCYDARPFPQYPEYNIWQDGYKWATGHWLNGKLQKMYLSQLLRSIALEYGYAEREISFQGKDQVVTGLVIDRDLSGLDILRMLEHYFGFHIKESENNILFDLDGIYKSDRLTVVHDICVEDIIKGSLHIDEANICNSPNYVQITFADERNNYSPSSVYVENSLATNNNKQQLHTSLVSSIPETMAAANRMLFDYSCVRKIIKLMLTSKHLYLQAGDIIRYDQQEYMIIEIEYLPDYTISIVAKELIASPKFLPDLDLLLDSRNNQTLKEQVTLKHLAFKHSGKYYFAAANLSGKLPELLIYGINDDEPILLTTMVKESTIGKIISVNDDKLIVNLISGEIINRDSETTEIIVGQSKISVAEARQLADNQYQLQLLKQSLSNKNLLGLSFAVLDKRNIVDLSDYIENYKEILIIALGSSMSDDKNIKFTGTGEFININE